MFNTQEYNFVWSQPADGTNTLSVNDYDIRYNNHSLNSGKYQCANLQYLSNKSIKYDEAQYSRYSGSTYNIKEWSRRIRVSGVIKAKDRNELLSLIDTLKATMLDPHKLIVVKEWSQKRAVEAICDDIKLDEDRTSINWMRYDITFITYDYMREYDPKIYTTGLMSWAVDRWGTAPTALQLTTTISATTWCNSITYDIGGKKLTIKRTMVAWDMIEIGTAKVTVNGSDVWFLGDLPKLESNSVQVTITHTGTLTHSTQYKYHPSYK